MGVQERKEYQCARCRRELTVGTNVFSIEEAVTGFQGIVPLADAETFCTHQCCREFLQEGYADYEPEPRIP